MSGQFNERDSGRLEQVGARAFRLLGSPGRLESAGSLELGGVRTGPPDQLDAQRITAGLIRSLPIPDLSTVAWDRIQESESIGNAFLKRANAVLSRMEEDGPRTPLSIDDAVALESVLMVRGRPSLRIDLDEIQPVDPELHPGSEMWANALMAYELRLLSVASSVGAIMVEFAPFNLPPQVIGTAWVVGDGTRVITNRHVVFPSAGPLARRDLRSGVTATMRGHVRLWVDFAHSGPRQGPIRLQVTDVLAVTPPADPIDAAILKLDAAGPPALLLRRKQSTDERIELIYVIGHPGRMMQVSGDVAAVFGNPDGRKRISFGDLMPDDPNAPQDLVHDASTIGGFSGGMM